MIISFKGFEKTERIADKQNGPVCWLEAIENLVQLDNPYISNDFSEKLIRAMIEDNYQGYNPQKRNVRDAHIHYPEILRACGIEADWYNFDHDFLRSVLQQNRGVFLMGFCQFLQQYNGQQDTHAIVLTDAKIDGQNCLWYYGIDSNFPKTTCYWPWNQIQDFALSYVNTWHLPALLVTRKPMRWPHKNS